MLETPEDKEDMIDELIDRFGDVPKQTLDLLTVSLARSAAMKCGIVTVVEDALDIRVTPSAFDFEVWSELSDEYKGRIRVLMSDTPAVSIRKQKGDNVPELLHKLFVRYYEILEKYL